jgi:hypothetical protein
MSFVRAMTCLAGCIAFGTAMYDGRSLSRASTFFGCEAGFTFESSGDAARCRRAATVAVASLIDCPQAAGAPLIERVDVSGAKDMCGSPIPSGSDVSVDRTCPPSYTKRVVPGRDRCEQPTPEMIRAPSVPVVK